MDALEVLREMHVEAKSAFNKLEQAGPDERGGLWAKLRPELVAHEQIEEQFVYDPVSEEAGGRDPVLTGWEDRHHQQVEQAERLIDQIGRIDPSDQRFIGTLVQLRQTLEQHIETEETEIWPRIHQVWSADKLDQVGLQVQAAKAAATAAASASGAAGSAADALRRASRWMSGD